MLSKERIDQLLQYVEDIRRYIAEQSAEISRLKAELERLKGEDKYAGVWRGDYLNFPKSSLFFVSDDWQIRVRYPPGWGRPFGIITEEFKSLIDSGAMKRVSKAEPSPLTSIGGGE